MKTRKVNEKSVKSNAKQESDVWGNQDPFQCVFKVGQYIESWWPGILNSFPICNSWLISKEQNSLSASIANGVQTPLVLVRGLPGSGKSTFAEEQKKLGYGHFETDQFFYKRGKFVYDAKRIPEAHAWCIDLARRAIEARQPVVVSNTFVHKSTMKPYLQLVSSALILEMGGTWPNKHGVPDEAIARMRAEWEHLDV